MSKAANFKEDEILCFAELAPKGVRVNSVK